MPQTDVLVIGFKSVSVVLVFVLFLLNFIYSNSIALTTWFKIINQLEKNVVLSYIILSFKNAARNSRTYLSTSFVKKIC